MDRVSQGAIRPSQEHPSSQRNTPRGTPLPLSGFMPPTAQPPVQMPFSDPFHSHPRDPFLPPSQHQRTGSYGPLAGPGHAYTSVGGDRAWNNPHGHHHHPPQSPRSAHQIPPSNSLHGVLDHSRRRSVGGAGSPPRYAGGPLDPPPPPPPPPAFAARNMPPPSPSSNPQSSFGAPRGPSMASPFGGMRDLPGFSSRPGGMSISSLIGGDSGPSREPPSRAATTQNSPTSRSPHAMSPQRARSTSMRSEYYRQQPDYGNAFGGRRSVENHHHPSAYGPAPPSGFRAHQSSPNSVNGDISRPVNGPLAAPPRPSSQPMAFPPEGGNGWKAPQQPARHPELSGFRPLDPHTARLADSVPPYADTGVPSRRPIDEVPRREHGMDLAGIDRFRDGLHSNGQNERMGPFRPMHDGQHTRHDEHYPGRRYDDRREMSPPRSVESTVMDGRFRHYGGQMQTEQDDKHRSDPHNRRDVEEGTPTHRSLLNLSPELSRKNGRASPLPQAVHGAQPRPGLPGRDPSVKNEFGRMFSGLGSGVGGSSTPTAGMSANGTTTPSRQSPANGHEGIDHIQHPGLENSHEPGEASKTSRKHRSNNDEFDSVNGRNTPTASGRGNKKVKTSHTTHHHHHHNHPHHHHHHHHNATEEHAHHAAGGFSTIRFPQSSTPTQAHAANAPLHHHHHHHHHGNHIHHHHHGAKVSQIPAPEVTVHSEGLLKASALEKRSHLGSCLYSASMLLPPNKRSSTVEAKYMCESSAVPIPRFDGNVNCTFTVRVPREYVRRSDNDAALGAEVAGGLEQICRHRAVWGSDIYTDDSDVVAAAVHSGWITGDYGEHNQDIKQILKEEELDMHITVLVLPPLEKYASSVMNNLRSRSWGSDHDGMSFKIHSIAFVDEPRFTRHVERSSQARKQRLKEELDSRREAAESLLSLGGKGVSVGA